MGFIAADWSFYAMDNAILRINQTADMRSAFAAIGEAVWWVTVVDQLLEGSPEYKEVVQPRQHPSLVLAGLRSVRNRVGHEVDFVDFVGLVDERPDPGDGRIAAWVWQTASPPASQRTLELDRYEAYCTALAGRNIVDAFTAAPTALRRVADLIGPLDLNRQPWKTVKRQR